jgi:type IV secretory pathway TraG/TraD family ATPase VirD4
MSRTPKRARMLPFEELLVVGALLSIVALVVAVWLAFELASVTGTGPTPPHDPFTLLDELARHRLRWHLVDTIWLSGEMLIALLIGLGTALGLRRVHRRRQLVDRRARYLAQNRRALDRYTDPSIGPSAEVGPGPVVGRDVVGGRTVRATWEDVTVMLAGQRMGKTTGWVVPAIIDAPGAVYATSNKRDIVDMTRGIRDRDRQIWLFDPQHIAGGTGTPDWWWNPLEMAGDVAGARTLAGLFATASRPAGSTTDAYFDPEGEELLAMMLLAAAAAGRPITDVFVWLTDVTCVDPVTHLRQAGFELPAKAVRGVLDHPEKQRAGVYGTAKKMVTFLSDPDLVAWATDPSGQRAQLHTDQFVASNDTLYGLSKSGPGSAGPLTGALTAGVLLAAERLAARSPAGRLPTPLVCALDEVANVCRWRDLPDLYSHYGSRGICLLSFLQSWSQGVEAWGREGMARLWGSANIRIYGGGLTEADFLEDVSRVCGEVDLPTSSISDSRFGRSVSSSLRKERVFDLATLAALPAGRGVVMLSGADPILVESEPCFRGRHAEAVAASVRRYGVT